MDLVAKRDHSENELRKKLANCCEPETLEHLIQWAHEQNWLVSPEKLVRNKWSANAFEGLTPKEKQKLQSKIIRFLIARGLEMSDVNTILKNEFKISGDIYDEEF